MRWILLVSLLLPAAALAQEPQPEPKPPPSLADLARKNREKKAQSEKKVRVITNADLKQLRSRVSTGKAPVSASAAAAVDSQTDVASAEDATPLELTPEEIEEWRGKFQEARQMLAMAVSEGNVLQLRMNNLRNAYLRVSDGTTQERIQAQLNENLQAIAANKTAQAEARSAIRQLQAEARAAGLAPGLINELTGTLPEPSAEILTPETVP